MQIHESGSPKVVAVRVDDQLTIGNGKECGEHKKGIGSSVTKG